MMYMKFQKLLLTGCRDMDKNIKISSKMGFSPICDPTRLFFKNLALSLLYPYGALTSWKKNDEWSPRRTDPWIDGQTNGRMDKGDYYGPHRVNQGSKIMIFLKKCNS